MDFFKYKIGKIIEDLQKANLQMSNPDEEADAELGEDVEHLVEDHVHENADAEHKEGHWTGITKNIDHFNGMCGVRKADRDMTKVVHGKEIPSGTSTSDKDSQSGVDISKKDKKKAVKCL